MKCQTCDGQYEDKLVARAYRRDSKVIVVDDVPVKVCSQCGDVLLKAGTVEMIQAALNEAEQSNDFARIVHLRPQAA